MSFGGEKKRKEKPEEDFWKFWDTENFQNIRKLLKFTLEKQNFAIYFSKKWPNLWGEINTVTLWEFMEIESTNH
jgi:hypothetical protein